MIIWQGERLSKTDIVELLGRYKASQEFIDLENYGKYYGRNNVAIYSKWADRKKRNKTPNNFVPTAYYHTLVDTMAGYMFQNVDYVVNNPNRAEQEKEQELLTSILNQNTQDTKDMLTGTMALIYNKAVELVYTVGDDFSTDIKYTSLPPENWIPVYNDDIEPKLYCAIRFYASTSKDYDYYIDVIYNDLWQYYKIKNNSIEKRDEDKILYFDECPVCFYKTELFRTESSFDLIIPYIDALDFIFTGNSNEIDKLVDAILVLGKAVSEEDKKDMTEWKLLENMKKEDRAEYITKDMSPEFREYVSKLLVNEIHKHSHVIDWYSPDVGLTGEVSAKALITRLFDMDLFSKRIELVYKEQVYRRLDLINQILDKKAQKINGEIEVIFNRTLPSDVVDKLATLQNVDFISNQTKCELAGIEYAIEKERKDAEMEELYKTLPKLDMRQNQDEDEDGDELD